MAPEIEVPPPNSRRGVVSMMVATLLAEASSLIWVQGTIWACSCGPVHCNIATAMDWFSPPRMACSTCGLRKAAT